MGFTRSVPAETLIGQKRVSKSKTNPKHFDRLVTELVLPFDLGHDYVDILIVIVKIARGGCYKFNAPWAETRPNTTNKLKPNAQ